MYFPEKFVEPLLKRFGGDVECGEFGVFGGKGGRSEFDVVKAQLLVSELAKAGWKGAPALYYETEGEVKIVQGNYVLLAACALDMPVHLEHDFIKITDDGLARELDTVSTNKDRRAVLFRSAYCDVFDQHERERKALMRGYEAGAVGHDWRASLPKVTLSEREVRAWNVLTGGCAGYPDGKDRWEVMFDGGLVEVLGRPVQGGEIPCAFIQPKWLERDGNRPQLFHCREVGALRESDKASPYLFPAQGAKVYEFVLKDGSMLTDQNGNVVDAVLSFSPMGLQSAVRRAEANQQVIASSEWNVGLGSGISPRVVADKQPSLSL